MATIDQINKNHNRNGAQINNTYKSVSPPESNSTESDNIYFDNYGNRRHIKRRHSINSYGYAYDYHDNNMHGDISERRDPGWYARLDIPENNNITSRITEISRNNEYNTLYDHNRS